jgi:hypothetical protein
VGDAAESRVWSNTGVRSHEHALARWIAALLAPVGLIGAHLAAFRVASGGHHGHDELLALTGHRSWWWIGAALVTITAYAVVVRVQRRTADRRVLFFGTLRVLAAAQLGAFGVLEALERVSVGGSPLGLLNERAFLLGLALQVGVALLAALVTTILARVVAWLVASPAPRSRRDATPSVRGTIWRPSSDVLGRPAAPRGPPVLL